MTREGTYEEARKALVAGGACNNDRRRETSASVKAVLEIQTARLGAKMTPGGGWKPPRGERNLS